MFTFYMKAFYQKLSKIETIALHAAINFKAICIYIKANISTYLMCLYCKREAKTF